MGGIHTVMAACGRLQVQYFSLRSDGIVLYAFGKTLRTNTLGLSEWVDLFWMGAETTACSCKHFDERSTSMTKSKCLDKLRDYQLLKERYFPNEFRYINI